MKTIKRNLLTGMNVFLMVFLGIIFILLQTTTVFAEGQIQGGGTQSLPPYSDYATGDNNENGSSVEFITEIYTATSNVNVRSAESLDSDVLGQLSYGDTIEVLCTSDDWAKVLYNGATAYVASAYLEKGKVQIQAETSTSETSAPTESNELLLSEKYINALSLYENESYVNALKEFTLLGTYKDAKQLRELCTEQLTLQEKYAKAILQYENSYFSLAYETFITLGDYKNSADYAQQCKQKISDINSNNVLSLFPKIDYGISLQSLCSVIGNNNYESGLKSFRNGRAYRSFSFDNDYTLNGIPSEVSFNFECEFNDALTVENDGVLISMTWKCPDDLASFEMYQTLQKYIISNMGSPTEESTSENIYGEIYSYFTYWGDMQLSYSTAGNNNNVSFHKNIVWSDKR